jgi:hypothetical protein
LSGIAKRWQQIAVGVSPRDANERFEPRSGGSNRRDKLLSPLRGLGSLKGFSSAG